jgi:hypothetical protein
MMKRMKEDSRNYSDRLCGCANTYAPAADADAGEGDDREAA